MAKLLRFVREPLLLLGLQGGAIVSTAIHPLMPLILAGSFITVLLLSYYNQVLLIILANIALVKGALIAQFPIFEIIDFTVLVSTLIFLVLAVKLIDPRVRRQILQYQYIIAAFMVWVVWMIISSSYAPHIDSALEKSFRFAFFTSILFLGPLVLIQSRVESKAMLNIFLGVGFLGAIYIIGALAARLSGAVPQQAVTRLSILSANPIGAGRVLSICAAMAAIIIITNIGRVRYWGLLLILFLVTALFTGSRGPVLSFLAAIFLLGILLGRKARRRTIYYSIMVAIIIMLVLILAPEELTSRYRLYMQGELAATRQGLMVLNTVTNRILMWSKALALWTSDLPHLLMGAGTAGYIVAFPWRDIKYPHNLPLEVLAEFGVIGLAVFSLHISLIVKQTFRRFRSRFHREEMLWLVGTLTMFFAALVSGDLNDNRLLWFFFGGLLATMNVNTRPQLQSNLD